MPTGTSQADFEAELARQRITRRNWDGPIADFRIYRWRKYEVVEVLQGDHSEPILYMADFEDHAEPGKGYVLFLGDKTIGSEDIDYDPRYGPGGKYDTGVHFLMTAPPYELVGVAGADVDLDVLLSPSFPADLGDAVDLEVTDPKMHPDLSRSITYGELRAAI